MLSPILSVCRPLRRMLALLFVCGFVSHSFARSLVKADIQLANNAVLAMHQDDRGNMWIGTYDGLHLYNGKNTFVFRMELDNEYSLCSNIVLDIVPAGQDYLWVVTSLGVNRFSLREFHTTVRDMEVWSFDGAMKRLFGPEYGIERLWNEYQEYLAGQARS